MRIVKTREKAKTSGIECIATTLTISPHKDKTVINRIGVEECGRAFLGYDFKKQDGFKKANAFSRVHDLYRQHYCGCVYSLPQAKD